MGADPLQKLRGIHAVFSSVLTSPQMAEPQVTHGDPAERDGETASLVEGSRLIGESS